MLTPTTPPCYLNTNQSENCARADHIPLKPSLSPFQGCLSMSHLFLHGPLVNISLLHTPMFWFVWPHCLLSIGICSGNITNQKAKSALRKSYLAVFEHVGGEMSSGSKKDVQMANISFTMCLQRYEWNGPTFQGKKEVDGMEDV